MALHSPILDDRSYGQLRDELIARIPVYAPAWTDHHPSDPGITLLELVAFLGENLLFRFNQIPDATRQAFLQLLQVPMRAATPATGLVRFTRDGAGAGVPLDIGTAVHAGDVPLRTTTETTVWPLEALAAIRERVTDEELDPDTEALVEVARAAVGADEDDPRYRTSFGASDPARPGGDLIDPATAIDGSLYVAVVVPDAATVVPEELAGGVLTLGVAPAEEVPTMADADCCPGPGAGPPSPPMQWQVCTTVPRADQPVDTADPVWLDLDVVGDTTGGLVRNGVVSLRMPEDLTQLGLYLQPDPDAHGAGDSPPLLEDPAVAARLVAWLRVYRPLRSDGGVAAIPALEWVAANAATVEQTSRANAELLGAGTGEPGQRYALVHGDVVGVVELDVEESSTGRWEPWRQVEDLLAAGPDDRVFVLDREAGTVGFGDGRRGRPPQIGERIRVRGYRWGGGADGNVGPGAVSRIDTAGVKKVKVTNDLPVRGGADAESLPEAMARIPTEFRRHDRAVTAGDFTATALETPGAGIGRADTVPLMRPSTPLVQVPGAVTVVVWPGTDLRHPRAPRPDRSTLQAVCAHLDQRRLVTTEVHVVGPTYRPVSVSVGIEVRDGHGVEAVRRWVATILRQYLAPLPPFGPDGNGWPLGRPVIAAELEAVALQVEGVAYLRGLRLSVGPVDGGGGGSAGAGGDGGSGGDWTELTDPARLTLQRWEVPDLAAITVTDGPPPPPGDGVPPAIPTGPAVPVREPRTVCR